MPLFFKLTDFPVTGAKAGRAETRRDAPSARPIRLPRGAPDEIYRLYF